MSAGADDRPAPPSRPDGARTLRGEPVVVEARRDRLVDEPPRDARHVDELLVAREHLSLLLEVSETLSGSLDHEMSLRDLAALLVPRLADGCAVDVVDLPPPGVTGEAPRLRRLVAVCADPRNGEWAKRLGCVTPPRDGGEGIMAIVRSGRAILDNDLDDATLQRMARDPDHLETLRALGPRCSLIIPLIARTRPIGVLQLFMAESGRRYEQGHLTLAQDLARRAALALDNARLFHEARDAVRVRDEFISVASHELKTPLTALHLRVQQLARALERPDPSIPVLRAKFGVVDRQCRRLERLVSQLLDVSRIVGGAAMELAEVDLGALTREVCAEIEEVARGAGSAISVRTPARGPVGHWDGARLERVIENLLTNAVKFGGGKPIEIDVDERDGTARVTVRDQGIGNGPEDRARIFERFERAVSARHYGGLGVGLWLCQQTAQAHGGRVEVDSSLGGGSSFTVSLPLALAIV
ncbi:MAG: HAMP domain-containing sensor histidine kinase [Polyangiaceae bacterium]